MKPERTPIRRPLFDAPIYPGEDPRTQERGIPLAGASIFATPEGKARTFGPDAYARYTLPSPQDKKTRILELAAELVIHPSYITSFFSFTEQSDAAQIPSLTKDLIATVPEMVRRSPFISARQATDLIELTMSPREKDRLFASFLLREYVKATLPVDPSKKEINFKTASEAQDRIVNLLYTLTLAGMETRNKDVYKFLYDVLSFRTPILESKDPQAVLFAIAGKAQNDDTLAKAVLIDQTTGLFEQMFAKYPGEYPQILQNTVLNGGALVKTLTSTSPIDRQRNLQLSLFYAKRYRSLGTYIEDENMDTNDYYTQALPFPEKIIFTQNRKMWPLYLEICSEEMMAKGKLLTPIAQFSLPDGSLRYIAETEGHSEEMARSVIAYTLNETHFPPEVYEKKVIETFLRFTTPDLSKHMIPEMDTLLTEKKQALLHPVRGIYQNGIMIRYKDGRHIAASTLSVDKSGKEITLRMGNYSLHLRLNQFQQLLDSEGHPLDIPEESRIWWETIILAPIKELVCPTREDGVLISGTEDLSPRDAVEQTKKKLFALVGHLRRLPPGKGYTLEQAVESQKILYPLPGIERLDLEQLNKELGFTKQDGQYTYVLPKGRDEKGLGPVSIHTPHAFDDLAKIMDSK